MWTRCVCRQNALGRAYATGRFRGIERHVAIAEQFPFMQREVDELETLVSARDAHWGSVQSGCGGRPSARVRPGESALPTAPRNPGNTCTTAGDPCPARCQRA